VCSAGSPPDCDDANVCTVDSCDEGRGRCAHDTTAACCTDDADCADSDLCTVNERCEDGTCVSDPVACTGGDACTEAICDPAFGCRLERRPNGTACEDGDPCTEGEVCRAGECAAKNGQGLRVKRFRLRNGRNGLRLVGSAVITPAPAVDPTVPGAELELVDAAGHTLYRAELPGAAFATARGGRVFTFRDGPGWASLPRANGLKRLVFKSNARRMMLLAKATILGLDGALEIPSLTWVVRSGDTCMRALQFTCTRVSARTTRCR
jgi:hypothetical protein